MGPRRQRLPAPQRRSLEDGMVAAGLACDKRKRWSIAEVVRWQGSTLKKRRGLVRWHGFDRETGLPWADTWEPWSGMTPDLQEEGRIRPRRRSRAEAGLEVGEREGGQRAAGDPPEGGNRRKSTRVAGEEPGPGLP